MIKTIVIDDELINIDLIKNLSKRYCPEIDIIDYATNCEDGIELIINKKPDLIFLDIQLHDKTSFDILKALESQKLNVIFITAYEQHALKAIKFSPIDYLLKPIQIEEFIASMEKYKKLVQTNANTSNPTINHNKLSIPYKDHIDFINFEDIICIEAQNTYSKISIVGNKSITISRSLKENEALLPKSMFIRVHHSYIVNVKYISSYVRTKTGLLTLTNGLEIPVAASKKKEIADLLHL